MMFLSDLSEDVLFSMSSILAVYTIADLILKTLTPLLFLQKTFFQHRRLGPQFGILGGKLLSKIRISNIF